MEDEVIPDVMSDKRFKRAVKTAAGDYGIRVTEYSLHAANNHSGDQAGRIGVSFEVHIPRSIAARKVSSLWIPSQLRFFLTLSLARLAVFQFSNSLVLLPFVITCLQVSPIPSQKIKRAL